MAKIIQIFPNKNGVQSISQTTEYIQSAIDECFLAGGGTVEIQAGEYNIGSIRIRSNVTIKLCKDARLIASRNTEDYFCVEKDTLEPIDRSQISDVRWIPMEDRTPEDRYSWINTIGSTWNHAIIRAVDAHNIAVIGEEGSEIDGSDCYDPLGEEYYRGPHGINIHNSTDITLRGYSIKNTGNWAHCICDSSNITITDLTISGGHDGIDILACSNVDINRCTFFTGDDCVAGYGSRDVEVAHCSMNTACSAFRIGGFRINIHDNVLYGPAKYLFRGSLTLEEKIAGKPRLIDNAADKDHRYNMLSAVTYFAADGLEIKDRPGDIIIKDCIFKNVDRFVHYNFSGNEPWQKCKPLHDITFENIKASGIKLPFTLYGDPDERITAEFENVSIEFSPDYKSEAVINTCYYDKILLDNVQVSNPPKYLIKKWSNDGDIIVDDATLKGFSEPFEVDATEEFKCDWI